jgi:putative flippase GtrA
MPLRGQLAVGGVIGLIVDAGVAQSLVGFAGFNPYTARVVSFLAAASVTWWWNRRHTFADRASGRSTHAEWLQWIGMMIAGAIVNNGLYVVLLHVFSGLKTWPAVAIAAGSAAGAIVNFALARSVLFKNAKTAP